MSDLKKAFSNIIKAISQNNPEINVKPLEDFADIIADKIPKSSFTEDEHKVIKDIADDFKNDKKK